MRLGNKTLLLVFVSLVVLTAVAFGLCWLFSLIATHQAADPPRWSLW